MIKKTRSKSLRSLARSRCGATLVESAVTLMIFFSLVLGMLDLGLGILRHQQLTDATRFVARQAAVHGELASQLGEWGPTAISGVASDDSSIGNLFAQRMVRNTLSQVTFTVDWPDAGNDVRNDHRVRVIASVPYRPMITFVFGSPTINLQSTSIVPIAH